MANDAPPMHIDSIETPRLQLSYRTSGSSDGISLLLLHGGFATSRWWEPLAAMLPDELRLIAPDLRGCGGSERSEYGYDIDLQSEDVAAFVQALQLDRFTIVGHALGAAIALEYAITFGNQLDALVLIAPPPLEGVETPPQALAAFEQMRTDATMLRAAIALLAPATARTDPARFDLLVQDATGMSPAAFVEGARALSAWNRLQESRTLTLPTLVIWGDQDVMVDRQSVMRTLISLPGAENLDIIHGVGHAPMLDNPLGLAERIVEFVTADGEGYAAIRENALAAPPTQYESTVYRGEI